MTLGALSPYNRRPLSGDIKPVRRLTGLAGPLALATLLAGNAQSASDSEKEDPENIEQVIVEAERIDQGAADSFGILSSAPVDTVFGLGKTLHETPRAAASLSADMLSLYGVERVTDFSNVSPGAFTASFFGLAASIDLRGSIADTHFRGIRRLTSSGGWESLIGAAHRVDIVRGPASPIHGPGSISGYLNVVPKTARADEGRFIEAPTGEITLSAASWNRFGVEAERGGPMTLLGKPAGYHAFVLWEDADGYYNHHPGNRQFMTQATLVVDVRDNIWIEAGHQYQRWRGAEVGGWNRIDQALIDDGLYLSGAPLVNLDTDGNGRIGQAEIVAVSPNNRLSVFTPYGAGFGFFDSDAERDALKLDPSTLQRVRIGADDCLCAEDDEGAADSLAVYFDVVAELKSVSLRQKLFIDFADRHIVSSYGFSQTHRTLLVEERIEAAFNGIQVGDALELDLVVAPNLRYYDTRSRQDLAFEFFNRRDISKPPSALDLRVPSYGNEDTDPFNSDVSTEWLNLGFAAMADFTLLERLSLLAGARWDHYDLRSRNGPNVFAFATPNAKASKKQGEFSWSLSASLALGGWRPYVTFAEQALTLGGQSGAVSVNNVEAGPLGKSSLKEAGLKFAGLDGRLQAALALYDQKRIDYSALADSNLAVRGKGAEFELRAAFSERLALLFSATRSRIYREPLTGRFIFAPAAVTGFAPEDQYGGNLVTVLPAGDRRFRQRGALPEYVVSAGGSFRFSRGLGLNLTASRVGKAWSGVARTVRLPAYTLVNASLSWTRGPWQASLAVNNALDKLYFQGNFPQIFGDLVVLPRPPRNWRLTLSRRFGV
ncbi:MAG: TonB-dependent receptor [Gammaproteobacteria bacterium]|nr:TonB-dependent receptor [Gammaproteobacteria bacterium]MYK83032.1 TonB-dependent receptor [Gammaproteobacteria bacterium]